MLANPTRLSDCGPRWTLDDTPGHEYHIQIDPGTHLAIEAGTLPGTPAARFTHPNIAATLQRLYHFRVGPRRRWTARPGLSHYLVIPREAILLVPERGYSYIPALINGVRVRFNVSGGTLGCVSGWLDHLPTFTQIGVGHPLHDLQRLAAVAVRGTPLEPLPLTPLTPADLERWGHLAAEASLPLKQYVFRLVEQGSRPLVHLLPRYEYDGHRSGPGISIARTWRVPRRAVAIILQIQNARVRAKLHQIDWFTTGSEVHLSLDPTGSLQFPTASADTLATMPIPSPVSHQQVGAASETSGPSMSPV